MDIKGIAKKPQYSDEQMEAAITLQGFKELLAADPTKVIHEDGDDQFSERDYAASILADRINKTPFYQEKFNIGGDTGRKVVGFSPLVSDVHLQDESMKDLPRDAFIPIIENSKTESTGPMTLRASSDSDDELQYITLSNLEKIASE